MKVKIQLPINFNMSASKIQNFTSSIISLHAYFFSSEVAILPSNLKKKKKTKRKKTPHPKTKNKVMALSLLFRGKKKSANLEMWEKNVTF